MRRSLPHGLYSLAVVVLACTGWFASLWEGDGCDYAIVTGPIVDQLDPSYTSSNPVRTLLLGFDSYREQRDQQLLSSSLQSESKSGDGDGTVSSSSNNNDDNKSNNTPSLLPHGPLTVANVTDLLKPTHWTTKKNRTASSANSCTDYPQEVTLGIMDSSWTTSRSFAFLGLVLGGAGTAFLLCSLCFVFSRVTWRWTGYELLLAALCQTLSLVAWFSTQLCSWNDCGLGVGSKLDLVSAVLWCLTGAMVVSHYPPAGLGVHGSNSSGNNGRRGNGQSNSRHSHDSGSDHWEDDDENYNNGFPTKSGSLDTTTTTEDVDHQGEEGIVHRRHSHHHHHHLPKDGNQNEEYDYNYSLDGNNNNSSSSERRYSRAEIA